MFSVSATIIANNTSFQVHASLSFTGIDIQDDHLDRLSLILSAVSNNYYIASPLS